MIQLCDAKMVFGYQMVSARSVLRELMLEGSDLQQILQFIADGGFDYCLDPAIPMTGHHEAAGERPHRDVCYWGPDQLKSRLQSLRNVPYGARR
jgi:hypothetical protein